MKCPNCGKFVRSTNQCAHCGYVFTREDVREMRRNRGVESPSDDSIDYTDHEPVVSREGETETETNYHDYVDPYVPEGSQFDQDEDDEEIVFYEEPRHRRSFGKIIWGLMKLALAIVVIFLAFFYGPRFIREGMNYFNKDEDQPTVMAPVEESDSVESDMSVEDDSVAEEVPTSIVDNFQVKTNNYPIIEAVLTVNEPLNNVSRETFDITVKDNGVESAVEDYALTVDGRNILINFNDPTQNTLSASEGKPELVIKSAEYEIDESATYSTPQATVDTEGRDHFNEQITQLSGANRTVVSYFADVNDDSIRYSYDNQTVEAGNLISWFVLERVFEAVEAEQIDFDTEITVRESLIADGEDGIIANAIGEIVEVQDLLALMLREQDISAINHLIQETGGPNEFNAWLNEQNYFATKINALLEINENGGITGAVTDAQDLATLLKRLAEDKLVSPNSSQVIKEILLETPLTNKFPVDGIPGIVRRYEISSSDYNPAQQYYTGILSTEETQYIVIILVNNSNLSDDEAYEISHVVESLVYQAAGEELMAAEDEAEEVEEAEEEYETYEEPVQQPEAPAAPATGAGSQEYYYQPVIGLDEPVLLPDRAYQDSTGQWVEPTWYYNAEEDSYYYE